MSVLKKFASSKKFVATLGTLVVITVAILSGVTIPEDLLVGALGLVATYVLGQGIADHGKEANVVAAEARLVELELINTLNPPEPPSQP